MARSEFSKGTKRDAFARALGRCEECTQSLAGRRAEYDHIIPDYIGGTNDLDNCRVLCPKCHRSKTVNEDRPKIDKTRRLTDKAAGLRKGRGFYRPRNVKYNWTTGRYEQDK